MMIAHARPRPRSHSDNGVSSYILDGNARDMIAQLALEGMGRPRPAWQAAIVHKLWRQFGVLEDCADRPSPKEWR